MVARVLARRGFIVDLANDSEQRNPQAGTERTETTEAAVYDPDCCAFRADEAGDSGQNTRWCRRAMGAHLFVTYDGSRKARWRAALSERQTRGTEF